METGSTLAHFLYYTHAQSTSLPLCHPHYIKQSYSLAHFHSRGNLCQSAPY
jgi:hypothetical protein